jgi:4-alpha-glucanotransferase
MSVDYKGIIDQLASLCGIEPEYTDIWGNRHKTSPETKLALLEALGVKTGSEKTLRRELSKVREKLKRRFLEPVIVVAQRELSKGFPIHLPEENVPRDFELEVKIRKEQGKIWEKRLGIENLTPRKGHWCGILSYQLPLPPDLSLGYHKLKVVVARNGSLASNSSLIVHPETVYLPQFLKGESKTWGIFLPLYAVKSPKNWGVGDLRDLREILGWMGGKLKAGLIGINPLHAIKNRYPYNLSPYFPSSRIYRNFIYLDVEGIPEFKKCPKAQEMVQRKEFQRELETLRSSPLVDYERAALLKLRVLELLFEAFLKEVHGLKGRAQEFDRYRKKEGKALEEFAIFQALAEHFPGRVWPKWPRGYQDPKSREVRSFQRSHQRRILFFEYIQWIIEEQLAQTTRAAHKLGMPLGLYGDLALGVEGGGSEAWSNQRVLASGAELGAPPDEFFPKGQRWGLPPVIPERLREEGYRLFIQTLRHNLPEGGALRIDHVMGLFRTYWVPSGMAPQYGAYVRGYPEELLGILALESHLQKTLIVGEDLGTVPPWVRTDLANWGILSSKVFYFERESDGSPIPPERYPSLALAGINTHDMPTLKGFWRLKDIELREKLGLYPKKEMAKEERRRRERQKEAILQALKLRNLLPTQLNSWMELLKAIIFWLAFTPCKILVLNIWDLLGEDKQQNLPGTVEGHPNWRLKLSRNIREIVTDQSIMELADLVNSYKERGVE